MQVIHEEPQPAVPSGVLGIRRVASQEGSTILQHFILGPAGNRRMSGTVESCLHHGGVSHVAFVKALSGGAVGDAECVEDGHRGNGGDAVEHDEGGVVMRDIIEHGGERCRDHTAGALADAGETAELLPAGVIEGVAVGAEGGAGRCGWNGLTHDHVDAEGADVLLINGLVLREEFCEKDEAQVDGARDRDKLFEEAERRVVAVVEAEAVEEEGGDRDILLGDRKGGGEVTVFIEVAKLDTVAPNHHLALQILGVDHVVRQFPVGEECVWHHGKVERVPVVVPGPAVVGAVAAASTQRICTRAGDACDGAVAVVGGASGDGCKVGLEKRVMTWRSTFKEAVVDGTANGGEDGGEEWRDESRADEGVEGGDDLLNLVAIESIGGDGLFEGLDVERERKTMTDIGFEERLLEEFVKKRVGNVMLWERNGGNGEEGRERVKDGVETDQPVLLEAKMIHFGSDAGHDFIESLLGVDLECLLLQRVGNSFYGKFQLDGWYELRCVGVVEGHIEMVCQYGIVEGRMVQHDVRDEEEMVALPIVLEIGIQLLIVLLLDVRKGMEANSLRRKEVEFGEEDVHCYWRLQTWRGGEEAVVNVQKVADGEAAATTTDALHGSEMDTVVSTLEMKKGQVKDEESVEKNVIPAVEVSHAPGEQGLDAQSRRSNSTPVDL